jgi:hypothetical protein
LGVGDDIVQLDEAGATARMTADQLGHSRVSLTRSHDNGPLQKRYPLRATAIKRTVDRRIGVDRAGDSGEEDEHVRDPISESQ